jgi:hypothetical protein
VNTNVQIVQVLATGHNRESIHFGSILCYIATIIFFAWMFKRMKKSRTKKSVVYCNFARVHQTLRVTPAMEAGISDHVWTLEEIVGLLSE